MDVFDDLLGGIRGRGAVFDRSVLSPPWAVRFVDGASLTLCVPLRGQGWIVRGSGKPRLIGVGETAVVRGPEPFVFTDDPAATPPEPPREVRCDGGGATDGSTVAGSAEHTVLLAAAFRTQEQVPRLLLRALPPVLVVPDGPDCAALRSSIETQVGEGRSGGQPVLDRLLDWLLVCTLRHWFDGPGAAPPTWYRALGDAVVGPALRAVHTTPERPWTIASLAAQAGVSRTTLARRFTELVGEPPLTYLTRWRMALAADLLAETELTVGAVARRVGYADAFAFSTAFKRVRGISPTGARSRSRDAGERSGEVPPLRPLTSGQVE
ncbi:AraC family transcriptional regulator [Thermobifida halotolerans]|uniref:AraC family transcriptional regulator n=1 Tax=Thermobifida halotolerans TaxID=483545 RepID=A0AA97LZ71_9ACTN|nr:AraC family transcriptional regulator [Thermobifida halotolerans]UOE21057.1 AraC family transcriptional regulator [Thermobifida halotolerans]